MKIIIKDISPSSILICDECGKPNHYLLEIGEQPDHESSTAWLCFDCINKALNVVKQQIPKKKRRSDVCCKLPGTHQARHSDWRCTKCSWRGNYSFTMGVIYHGIDWQHCPSCNSIVIPIAGSTTILTDISEVQAKG